MSDVSGGTRLLTATPLFRPLSDLYGSLGQFIPNDGTHTDVYMIAELDIAVASDHRCKGYIAAVPAITCYV